MKPPPSGSSWSPEGNEKWTQLQECERVGAGCEGSPREPPTLLTRQGLVK